MPKANCSEWCMCKQMDIRRADVIAMFDMNVRGWICPGMRMARSLSTVRHSTFRNGKSNRPGSHGQAEIREYGSIINTPGDIIELGGCGIPDQL